MRVAMYLEYVAAALLGSLSRALIIAVLALISLRNADAEERAYLVIDPKQVSEAAWNALLEKIPKRLHYLGPGQDSGPKNLRIPAGESFFKLARKHFNYGRNDVQRDSVVGYIRALNGIGEEERFKTSAPRTVTLPSLPARPLNSAEVGTAQIFDLSNKAYYVVNANSCELDADMALERCKTDKPLERGRDVVLSAEKDTLIDFLKKNFSEESRAELTQGGIIASVEVVSLDGDPASVALAPSGQLPSKLPGSVIEAIKRVDAGDLIILDKFGNEAGCDQHGERVAEVARLFLKSAGVEELAAKIRHVPFTIQATTDELSATIGNYVTEAGLAQFAYNIGIGLLKASLGPQRCSRVPSLYLPSIWLQLVGSKNPRSDAIVSMSFYQNTSEGFEMLTPSLSLNRNALMVAAVLNEQTEIEQTWKEPQRTFVRNRDRGGLILVGARDARAKPYGMISKTGIGVTVVAPGTGYAGDYVKPHQIGTSYATPHIAAMLFIAKHYYKANGIALSPMELERRLVLAADVDSQMAGKYASSGVPKLDRLVGPLGPYLVKKTGEVVALKQVSGDATWVNTFRSGCHSVFAEGQLLGLAQDSAGDLYAILDNACGEAHIKSLHWHRIDLNSFNVQIDEGAGLRPLSLDEFKSTLKSLVRP